MYRVKVHGLGFRAQGLAFRLESLGSRVLGLRFGGYALGFRVQGSGFKVWWLYFRLWGLGFRQNGMFSSATRRSGISVTSPKRTLESPRKAPAKGLLW